MNGRVCGCGAPIVFVPTPNGRSMPLDGQVIEGRYEPLRVEGGNVVLERTGRVLQARVLRKGEVASSPTHRSHYASCPDAASHRKAK